MGQQNRKVIKRVRRKNYLKRKKEQSKLSGVVKKRPATKKADSPAKKAAAKKTAAKKTVAKKAPAKKAAKKAPEQETPADDSEE
ncbi:topoisomerase IA-like protein [Haloferula luteola]|uniref:Topoisomerase IA-like protein n=1 Tax=Haloferula luteola TaxID=595692 RepID=A0A840VHJ3_9BACT|nr:hypothetical protein [Haloferula luteola]MBB5352221.1 topoisomerase IA-like protein [Haloferula luteola]